MQRNALLLVIALAMPCSGAEFVAPYVPTVADDVELLLDLATVDRGDYLIDLGSGDGRIVIAAARRGAMAHGVELDPELVAQARQRAREVGVEGRAAFSEGDIFAADIAVATVVTLYLWPDANLQLRPKLLAELRPGTRVISNAFDMGDWEPDAMAQGRTSGGAMLWIVPGKAAGRWSVSLGGEELTLDVAQRYQHIEVELHRPLDVLHVSRASLSGDRITLVADDDGDHYGLHGRIVNDSMSGYAHIRAAGSARVSSWTAVRIGDHSETASEDGR